MYLNHPLNSAAIISLKSLTGGEFCKIFLQCNYKKIYLHKSYIYGGQYS